jgi:hypothetical protein
MLSRRTIRGPTTGAFHAPVWTVRLFQRTSLGNPTFTDVSVATRTRLLDSAIRCSTSSFSRQWHPVRVGLIFRLAELLLVALPLAGAVWAAVSAWRRGERARSADHEHIEAGAATRRTRTAQDEATHWRTVTRILEQHAGTDTRWLDYELDAAKLLDFPLMTDMTNPLVMRFHKAKLRADLLRPDLVEELLDDWSSAGDYLAAVEDYVTAFNAAEAEAFRLRRSEFSREAQQRIARAQSLLRVAADSTATPPERSQAYELAGKELDGLIVLPESTRLGLERGIAGELD